MKNCVDNFAVFLKNLGILDRNIFTGVKFENTSQFPTLKFYTAKALQKMNPKSKPSFNSFLVLSTTIYSKYVEGDDELIRKIMRRLIPIKARQSRLRKLTSFLRWRKFYLESKRKNNNQIATAVSNRLYDNYKYKERYLNALKIISKYKEGEVCTFRPQINRVEYINYYFPVKYEPTKIPKDTPKQKTPKDSQKNITYVYPTTQRTSKVIKLRTNESMPHFFTRKNYLTNTFDAESQVQTKTNEFNSPRLSLATIHHQKASSQYLSFRENSKNYQGLLSHRLQKNSSASSFDLRPPFYSPTSRTIVPMNQSHNSQKTTASVRSKKDELVLFKNYSTCSKISIPHKGKTSLIKSSTLNQTSSIKENETPSTIVNNKSYSTDKNNHQNLQLDIQYDNTENPKKMQHSVLTVNSKQFSVAPAYPQLTHVTLQSLSDGKILELANNYVGTDESLERFRLNLKK